MRSATALLKIKLKTLLDPIGYPVYSNYVPANVDPAAYILISNVSDNDDSPKNAFQADTDIQIGIYTNGNLANAGDLCDTLKNSVLQTILPTPGAKLDLSPNFDNYAIEYRGTTSQTLQLNNFIGINAFVNFRFKIYQTN